MIKMLPKLRIPVPPRRDMEIPLHLISLQTPVYPAAMARTGTPAHPFWRFLELFLLLPPYFPQYMSHVRILLFFFYVFRFRQSMCTASIHPMRPTGGILGQHFTG